MLRGAALTIARRQRSTQALLLRDFVIGGRTEPSGSIVTVSAGYLRNYLLPRDIAVPLAAEPEAAARALANASPAAAAADAAAAPEDAPASRATTYRPSARTPSTPQLRDEFFSKRA